MRRLGIGVGIVVAGAAVGALAFGQVSPKKRVLHEDLPAPASDPDSPMIGADPRAGKNPAAFSSGDKVLPEPSSDPSTDDEPVLGRGGFAADRETSTTPDDQTGADGTLHYVSVFNPDVLPFKRMTAMDTVRDDYTLAIGDPTLREVPVGGKSDPSRDRFWGSVLVELEPGKDAPLPSVAPDMRILSYESNPSVTLVFSKDRADNFSVRTDDPAAHGTFRVVFLVDADAGYFAPALPARSYTLAQVRAAGEARGILATLGADVAAEARRSLHHLDIDRDDDLESAFNKLVYWFRGFSAKPITNSSGLLYRDLVNQQAGVCRHRSYAFIVTALAAGIPTRYVTNEAHAFVEVWFPDRGWQRIDLGGAALRLEVENGEGKTLHRPRREDPFDKPPEYSEQYTQLDGDIQGLTEEQIDERRAPLGDGSSGDYGPLVDGAGPDTDDGAGSGSGDAVSPGNDVQARPPDPRKITPTVTVTRSDDSGYRGEAVEVEGRVDGDQGGLAGVRVDVFVAPYGHGGNDGRLIGRGVTEADGRFVVDADLPGDLDLATYELFVTTPETDQLNAAQSF